MAQTLRLNVASTSPMGPEAAHVADLVAVLDRKASRLDAIRDRDGADRLRAAARLLAGPDVMVPSAEGKEAAKRSSPRLIATLFQLAAGLGKGGDGPGAEILYRAILALDRGYAMVWSNLAALLVDAGRLDEAIVACRSALALQPDLVNAQLNLAKVYQRRDMKAELVDTLLAVTTRHPRRADLLPSLAEAYVQAGRPADALSVYDRILATDPDHAESHFATGDILKGLGRIDEAIARFAIVIRLRPDHAVAMSNRGILMALHSRANDLDEAADLCLRAATLQPDNVAILNNLGVVLQVRGDTENALLVFRQLVAQEPDFAPAHSNIGSMLAQRAFYDEAEEAFLAALAIDPTLKEPRVEMTKIRRHLCDWSRTEDKDELVALNGGSTNFLIAFMALSASAEEQLTYARQAMPRVAPQPVGRHANAFDPLRLRIGYLSGDFKEHPVGHLVPDLVALHDRSRFDIIGYSVGTDDKSALRRRLVGLFDQFRDLDRLSDIEAAKTILADRIDILVDLTGPTAGGRFGIPSLRPAPIQVSFLGLPGTTGAECIDYLVADSFLVPPGSERFYQERIVRLPHCYQPCDTARRPAHPLPTRAACGLPERGFVFASFNNAAKIGPDVFDAWMRILAAVDGSVLWLYARSRKARVNLVERARRRGIAEERLVFAEPVAFASYLARMACADLFLDTFPYAAGATCNDALWMGLPVLTCVGETYVSRMGGSLLTTLGLPDLVTETLADYERRAIELAGDPVMMREVRDRVAGARTGGALFDMPRFTKGLEKAYVAMARRGASGAAPAGFDVAGLDGVGLDGVGDA